MSPVVVRDQLGRVIKVGRRPPDKVDLRAGIRGEDRGLGHVEFQGGVPVWIHGEAPRYKRPAKVKS